MTTPAAIKTALASLDVKNDANWTAEGFPRLDVVKGLVSDPTLTRELLTVAAPGFTRTNPIPTDAPAAAVAPATAPATPPVAPVTPTAPAATAPAATTAPDATVASVAPATDQTTAPVEQTDAELAQETKDDLDDDIATEALQLDKMTAVRDQMNAAIATQQKQLDALRVQRQKLEPKNPSGVAIQLYLASQRKRLQERAARAEAIRGIDLRQLLPGMAPIDAAMQRKNTRGTQRPQMLPAAKK